MKFQKKSSKGKSYVLLLKIIKKIFKFIDYFEIKSFVFVMKIVIAALNFKINSNPSQFRNI